MAEPLGKTSQTNPNRRRRKFNFLACFGFSYDEKPTSKKSSGRQINNSPSISWPMFHLNSKKSHRKTVPLDNTGKNEAADSETHKSKKKSHSKLDNKSHIPPAVVSNHKPSRQNSKADQEKSKEPRQETGLDNIFLGNRKLLDPTRTGSSQPGSPNTKAKSKTHTSKLTHTVSLPVLEGQTRQRNPRVHARVNVKELRPRNNIGLVEKLDPIIGMSIIMVTLMIMLIWGRLCAVLCTSAWFYFVPLFRTIDSNHTISNNMDSEEYLDLNSEEYKKKVVLEGLLERTHRIG